MVTSTRDLNLFIAHNWHPIPRLINKIYIKLYWYSSSILFRHLTMLHHLPCHVFHMCNCKHELHFAFNGYVYLWPLTSMERIYCSGVLRAPCKPIQNCHWHLIIIGTHRYHTQLAHWTSRSRWSICCTFITSLPLVKRKHNFLRDVIIESMTCAVKPKTFKTSCYLGRIHGVDF